ncbi:MAG: hypothetical protein PUJ28_08820 [Prevotellaceae bacterium]|nr:hypothetical protein [Prevotella sp.]MDD7658720.1 hypothetical protein [Prevotellaceae bacterium]
MEELDKANLSPFYQQKNLGGSKEKGNGFAFIDVMPLQSKGLYAYLHSRCINTTIAKRFLKEAHYVSTQLLPTPYKQGLESH